MGLNLQTTEIFLLNDLGSELCIEKKGWGGGRERERDTPHREVERRLDGAVLAQVPKTQRDRDTETDRDQNRSGKRQKRSRINAS